MREEYASAEEIMSGFAGEFLNSVNMVLFERKTSELLY
jgi:hypothetical protein